MSSVVPNIQTSPVSGANAINTDFNDVINDGTLVGCFCARHGVLQEKDEVKKKEENAALVCFLLGSIPNCAGLSNVHILLI